MEPLGRCRSGAGCSRGEQRAEHETTATTREPEQPREDTVYTGALKAKTLAVSDRMTAAQYRALHTGKPRQGSKRGTAPNVYKGLRCELCGKLVRSDSSPAQLHTDVAADGTETRRVQHLQRCP